MKRLLLFEPDAGLGTGALLMLLLGVICAAVPERLPVFCAVITLLALAARIALRKVITAKRAVIAGRSKAGVSGALSALFVCAGLCAAYLIPVIILPPLCVPPPALELFLCAAGFVVAFLSLLGSVAALIEHGFYAGAVLSVLMVFFAIPAMN